MPNYSHLNISSSSLYLLSILTYSGVLVFKKTYFTIFDMMILLSCYFIIWYDSIDWMCCHISMVGYFVRLCFLCSFNLPIKAYVIEKDDTLGNVTQISEIDDLRLLKEKRNWWFANQFLLWSTECDSRISWSAIFCQIAGKLCSSYPIWVTYLPCIKNNVGSNVVLKQD